MIEKTCSQCRQSKPLDEFSPSKTGKYGRRSACKECRCKPDLKQWRSLKQNCDELIAQGCNVGLCSKCQECKPIEGFNKGHNTTGKRSWCRSCTKAYYYENHTQALQRMKEHYLQNQNRIRAYRHAYYQKKRSYEQSCNRHYYKINQKEVSAHNKLYRKLNPHIKKVSEHRRLARKRSLPVQFSAQDWQRAIDYFGGACAACGHIPTPERSLAPDHWIALASADCPGTIVENIVPLCHGKGGCNNEKQHLQPVIWLERKFGKASAKTILQRIENYFDHVRNEQQ